MAAGEPLYGLAHASHDFTEDRSWGKNIFTNAFPVAVAQYEAIEMELDPILIRVASVQPGQVITIPCPTPWREIINTEPASARFEFETPFEPYRQYTSHRGLNNSDVIVADANGLHRRALEIKLTTVPDSASHEKPKDEQSSEIVARPLMVEQLAVSIAHSLGPGGRDFLFGAVQKHVNNPQQARWTEASWMRANMSSVLAVVEDVISRGIEFQTAMVLNVIWRTVGRTAYLEDDCFETFVWTDMAFAALFHDSAARAATRWERGSASEITRPQRSLIWLVKMLWDYQSQGEVDAVDATALAYGLQTDKAGSFSGGVTRRFYGPFLNEPRVPNNAVSEIINSDFRKFLAPERRLDAALVIESLMQTIESLTRMLELRSKPTSSSEDDHLGGLPHTPQG